MTEIELVQNNNLRDLIYTIRGMQVMIDSDLAALYGVETKVLNQAVKRNEKRFPEQFRLQLTQEEFDELAANRNRFPNLKSQIVTSSESSVSLRSQNVTLKNKRGGHRKYLPYAFTEQGVAMLSAVLKSETAVQASIRIMDAFVEMRKFIAQNAGLFQRVEGLERKQLSLNDLTVFITKDPTMMLMRVNSPQLTSGVKYCAMRCLEKE